MLNAMDCGSCASFSSVSHQSELFCLPGEFHSEFNWKIQQIFFVYYSHESGERLIGSRLPVCAFVWMYALVDGRLCVGKQTEYQNI